MGNGTRCVISIKSQSAVKQEDEDIKITQLQTFKCGQKIIN